MRSPRSLLLVILALAAASCGSGDDSAESEEAGTTQAPAGGCEPAEKPEPKPDGGQEPPTETLDPQRTYELVVETNCGSFTITLDVPSAPSTAASFAALAKAGFFDDTVFHRIVPGFVIQGGDPTGRGTGGPGYKTVDRPPADARYTKGVVAMAKAAHESPGTSGSQFFVVTSADAGLPPDYAILGTVTEGLDTVERIGQLGDPATEQPTQPVVISKMTVREAD